MVLVRELGPEDWEILRSVRLAALSDAPSAFGSTRAREAAFDEADWRRRLLSGGATFLASLPDDAGTSAHGASTGDGSAHGASTGGAPELAARSCGLASGFLEDSSLARLVSMWVDPAARGHGVGDVLIKSVTAWAVARGAKSLHLWVTESNAAVLSLYERHGFVLTGERKPLPSDARLTEIAMRLPLLPAGADHLPHVVDEPLCTLFCGQRPIDYLGCVVKVPSTTKETANFTIDGFEVIVRRVGLPSPECQWGVSLSEYART